MSAVPYRCDQTPMGDQRTETLWSECFQDLGSWCHLPQDELSAPIPTDESDCKLSFDDQSMYYPWEANSSSADVKSEMWKPEADLLSLQLSAEGDNNTSMLKIMPQQHDNRTGSDTTTGIRYSGNLFLSQCPISTVGAADSQDCHTEQRSVAPPADRINTSDSTLRSDQRKSRQDKTKPLLKLNIAAANKPPTAATTLVLNTPDVLKSLSEDPNFNLLSYVCAESYEDQNLIAVDPNCIVSQRPKELSTSLQTVFKIDHDYTETQVTADVVDAEEQMTGMSQAIDDIPPVGIDISPVCSQDMEYKVVIPVKEEPEDTPPSPCTSTSSLGKRVRKVMTDSDYVYDPPSDPSSDWSVSAKKKSKTSRRKSGEGSRSRNSSISDSSSVSAGPDKYRELRDRNNEASRRSRMNRKKREVEMMQHFSTLQQDNLRLKIKSQNLERRVKALRDILLKVVMEKNK